MKWPRQRTILLGPDPIHFTSSNTTMTCKNAIGLAEDVIRHISEIRTGKKCRYTIYGFSNDGKEIIIKKIGGPDETLNEFVDSLPENEVVYCVYSYGFNVDDGTRRGRTCFITWVPPSANRIQKFMAANSKSALRAQLGGVLVDFMFSSKDEITDQELYDKCIKSIH